MKTRGRLRRLVGDDEQLTLVYVNQWGGQDELVFDGQSLWLIVGSYDIARTRVERDEFALRLGEYHNRRPLLCSADESPLPRLDQLIVMSLRDYARKSGFSDAVVASSGGVDSALTIALACEALGPVTFMRFVCPRCTAAITPSQTQWPWHQALDVGMKSKSSIFDSLSH